MAKKSTPVDVSEPETTPWTLRVMATKRGYYGLLLRDPGEVFTITDPTQFSHRWMVEAGDAPVTRQPAETRPLSPVLMPKLQPNGVDPIEPVAETGAPTGDKRVI